MSNIAKKTIANCILIKNELNEKIKFNVLLEKSQEDYKKFINDEAILELHKDEAKTCIKEGDGDGEGFYYGCLEISTEPTNNNFIILDTNGKDPYDGVLPNIFYANIILDIRYRSTDNRVYARILAINFLRPYEYDRYHEDYSFEFASLLEGPTLEDKIKVLLSERNINGQAKYRYSFREIALLCGVSYYKVSSVNSALKVR